MKLRLAKAVTPLRLAGIVGVMAASIALGGCASSKSDAAKALNPDPPAKMYAEADALLQAGKNESAARKFEDLDRYHPYAAEARRAMVMAAFAYYRAGKYPEAIAAAKRYTVMHPGTKDAALAHHVIASSYFDEIKDPTRDQQASRKALGELKILVTRYPDSPYAKQATNRIRLAEDAIAANEMQVGRYYLKRANYVAAINRFKTVVAEFQTTAQVEEALMRLTETYMALGVANEAQTAAAILGHNFPQSPWYRDAYGLLEKQGLKPQVASGSWVSQQWKRTTVTPAGQRAPAPPSPAVAPTPPARRITPPPQEGVPTVSTPGAGRPMGLGGI